MRTYLWENGCGFAINDLRYPRILNEVCRGYGGEGNYNAPSGCGYGYGRGFGNIDGNNSAYTDEYPFELIQYWGYET